MSPRRDADPTDAEAPVTGHTWLYFVILTIVGYAFYWIGVSYSISTVAGINFGYLIWIIGAWYFVAGFKAVDADTLVGLQFWGIPTIVVTGFPIIILPGLFKVFELPRGTQQMELPDEPQNIFRQEDVELVPEGKTPPIRITFAQGASPVTDPLDERITAEVPVFVRFRVRDFWSFVVRIGTLVEARKQLNDTFPAELQTELGHRTVAEALKDKRAIDNQLDNLLRKKTKNWGIEPIDAAMKPFVLSHSLNEAIRDVAKSVAQKKVTINAADAEAYQIERTGQAKGAAAKALLDGETEGLKKRAADLKVEGADVLAAQVGEAIGTSPSTKIVLGLKETMEAAKGIFASTKTT